VHTATDCPIETNGHLSEGDCGYSCTRCNIDIFNPWLAIYHTLVTHKFHIGFIEPSLDIGSFREGVVNKMKRIKTMI
ncbi:hypothetical protein PFISCL1PPCAC_10830, partial [Pristionchus fissidentatus]